MVDPHRSAIEVQVVWSPAACAYTVSLSPAPPDFATAWTLRSLEDVATWTAHGQLAVGPPGRAHLLTFPVDAPVAALAILTPLDADLPARLDAALRLWRRLAHEAAEPPGTLTPQRRDRLVETLRALDARLAGATTREIASALFGAERVLPGPEWKSHDLRSRTKRLVTAGLALMNGGYRDLLRPPGSRRSD